LGFQTNSSGTPTTYFPGITIEVDGDSLYLLFDTGATAYPSDSAAAILNFKGTKGMGTSFITETIFKKWQSKHPDWKVIEHADSLGKAPMIEVPEINVANYKVGPVWFTARPDKNFTKGMSRWMDKAVVGALGGSAFKYFKIILDYRNQAAEFQK
jgi:hypothetical protein